MNEKSLDALAAQTVAEGDDDELRAILTEICELTGMGFAAIARVTEERWIACQVLDKIQFGLDPGDELAIATTICNDIRECGEAIVIDDVPADEEWRRHPVPALYGFKSYASFPVFLADGSFYGTLCAIDPEPRLLTSTAMVAALRSAADRVTAILSRPKPIPDSAPV